MSRPNPESAAASASASVSAPVSGKRRQAMTLLAAVLGWMFDGMEMGIFPLVARPALQHM